MPHAVAITRDEATNTALVEHRATSEDFDDEGFLRRYLEWSPTRTGYVVREIPLDEVNEWEV